MSTFENIDVGTLVIPTIGKFKDTYVVITDTGYKETNEISGVSSLNTGVLYFKNEIRLPTELETLAFNLIGSLLTGENLLSFQRKGRGYLFNKVTGEEVSISSHIIPTLADKQTLNFLGRYDLSTGYQAELYTIKNTVGLQYSVYERANRGGKR